MIITLINGYEYTCCEQSNLLDNNGDMHDFSHILSGCNVFVLRLRTSYGKKIIMFIYFSSVSHEISVNLIKRCHYSQYTILTNRSTRVLPSTTIRRIPQLLCFNRFQLKIFKPRPGIKLGWCKLHIEIGN